MTDFHEVQFPTKIAYDSKGGPRFLTTVVTTESGKEQRQGHWVNSRRTWNISTGPQKQADKIAVNSFFENRKGKLYGFRFKDWDDYKVSTATALLAIDSTHFQIVKVYTSGSYSTTRVIQKPVAGTVHLFNGITPVPTGWTVDTATGVVTYSSPPGYVPNGTCEFDVPARFDTDWLQNNRKSFSENSWDDLVIVEIKL